MHLSPQSWAGRAQAAACVLAVTLGLAVAPALVSTADAASSRTSASAGCTAAQAAVKKAKSAQASAKQKVVKAKKALKKAKKAHVHKKAKVAKAKKVLAKATRRYRAATKSVQSRQGQARTACAAATPPAPTNDAAGNLGKKLSLLGVGEGLSLDSINASQLTSLLDQLLPGVADRLSAGQLTALLAGFNSGGSLDSSDALALLGGVLSPTAITDLLGGSASPEALTSLITDIIGQLSSLGGNLPIPGGAFDPTGLWQTFAGILGNLDPSQLGSLLSLLTSQLGGASSSFDLGQLTSLLNSLVPGLSSQFDPAQLTSMLAGLNGGGLTAGTLSNLLGGQFSVAQLQSVLDGVAGQALLGSVIAQVVAQLGTAGAGGLQLPGALDPTQLTNLIASVTDLVGGLLGGLGGGSGGGGGGGVLPVVCGLIPLPGLCS